MIQITDIDGVQELGAARLVRLEWVNGGTSWASFEGISRKVRVWNEDAEKAFGVKIPKSGRVGLDLTFDLLVEVKKENGAAVPWVKSFGPYAAQDKRGGGRGGSSFPRGLAEAGVIGPVLAAAISAGLSQEQAGTWVEFGLSKLKEHQGCSQK